MNHSLTREALVEFLDQKTVHDLHLHLLRWLIWFPFLSSPELSCLMERREKTVAAMLKEMVTQHLLAFIALSEPETSRHYRFYVDDLGLYVFAAKSSPVLSVPRLVQAYAVDHDDLLARLVRPDLLRSLTEIATRLVTEGHHLGYPLTSYQQPWVQSDTVFSTRQTMRFDAALLIKRPEGTEHACYLRMDTSESLLFNEKRERLHLGRLLHLREDLLLQREQAPRLLIVTHAPNLPSWAHLLEHLCIERRSSLIEGGITIMSHIGRGIHSPIWWSFDTLLRWAHAPLSQPFSASCVPLVDLLGPPATSQMAERFSQRETFGHLLTESTLDPQRPTRKPLPNVVGNALGEDAVRLDRHMVADALSGTKAEQREVTALLSLTLQSGQKEILGWLAHHPLLTIADLAALLVPKSSDIRIIQRQMAPLYLLGLLVSLVWTQVQDWKRRERYLLSEAALRYIAMREGLPATTYLDARRDTKRASPLSVQDGAAGLFDQMFHTDGLYCCVRQIMEHAYREHVQVLTWKNARESVRTYKDLLGQDPMQARPDAELHYLLPGETLPRTVLIEYDRGTTAHRDYVGKFGTYADYQESAHVCLPLIAVITPTMQSVGRIHKALLEVAAPLHVVFILEPTLATGGFWKALSKPP